jgi:hypothetical protein
VKPDRPEYQTLSCRAFVELYKGKNRIVTFKLDTTNLYRISSIATEGSASLLELFHPDLIFEQPDMVDLSFIQRYFSSQEQYLILSSYLEGTDSVADWVAKYFKDKDEHGFIKQLYKFLKTNKDAHVGPKPGSQFNFLVGNSEEKSPHKVSPKGRNSPGSPVYFVPGSPDSAQKRGRQQASNLDSTHEVGSPGQRLRSPKHQRTGHAHLRKASPRRLPTAEQLGDKYPCIVKGLIQSASNNKDTSPSLCTKLSEYFEKQVDQKEELVRICAEHLREKMLYRGHKVDQVLEAKWEPEFVKRFAEHGDLDQLMAGMKELAGPSHLQHAYTQPRLSLVAASPDLNHQLSKRLSSVGSPRKRNWRRMMSGEFRSSKRTPKRHTGRTFKGLDEEADGSGYEETDSVIDSFMSSCFSSRPISEAFQKALCAQMGPRLSLMLASPLNLVKARLGHLLSSQEMKTLEDLFLSVGAAEQNDILLFEKLCQVEYMGEGNFRADDELLNLLTLGKVDAPQAGPASNEELVWAFVEGHINFLNRVGKLNQDEAEFLLYLLDEAEEVLMAAYEAFSLDRQTQELIETLRLVCVKMDDQPETPDSERNSSQTGSAPPTPGNPQPEEGRDSWPRNFGKVLESNKISKMLFSFKTALSPAEFDLLQKVPAAHQIADKEDPRLEAVLKYGSELNPRSSLYDTFISFLKFCTNTLPSPGVCLFFQTCRASPLKELPSLHGVELVASSEARVCSCWTSS